MTAGQGDGVPSIPILCFHAIEEGPGPLCFPPALFERHVKQLHEAGCRSITVAEVARRISSGEGFPQRAVAFTFDDGFASVHSAALGVLDAVGFTACIYPVTSHLDGVSTWIPGEGNRLRLLAPSQLRDLCAAGWEVGGHTHTHPQLPRLGAEEIAAELSRSTGILEDLTGEPIRTFAYPYGLHDAASRAAVSTVYDACLVNGASKATVSSHLDRLERVEAWYLHRAWQVGHLHDRLGDAYLALRRAGRAGRGLWPHRRSSQVSPERAES